MAFFFVFFWRIVEVWGRDLIKNEETVDGSSSQYGYPFVRSIAPGDMQAAAPVHLHCLALLTDDSLRMLLLLLLSLLLFCFC